MSLTASNTNDHTRQKACSGARLEKDDFSEQEFLSKQNSKFQKTKYNCMSLRNAIGMYSTVKQAIQPQHAGCSQHHDTKRQKLDDGCRGGKTCDENDTKSSIQTKESRIIFDDFQISLTANQEKEFKSTVIGSFRTFCESASILSTANTILGWSTRSMRSDIYVAHLRARGDDRLEPVPFSKWFLSKIEEYNLDYPAMETDTSANVQAHLASRDSKHVAQNFLTWLERTSKSAHGSVLALTAFAAPPASLLPSRLTTSPSAKTETRNPATTISGVAEPCAAEQTPSEAAVVFAEAERAGVKGEESGAQPPTAAAAEARDAKAERDGVKGEGSLPGRGNLPAGQLSVASAATGSCSTMTLASAKDGSDAKAAHPAHEPIPAEASGAAGAAAAKTASCSVTHSAVNHGERWTKEEGGKEGERLDRHPYQQQTPAPALVHILVRGGRRLVHSLFHTCLSTPLLPVPPRARAGPCA